MGIQGVLVGAPDGTWTMYAVADYSPVDFSFVGKITLLLSRSEFWVMAFTLSLSMTLLALVATLDGTSVLEKSFGWGLGILALLASGYILVMAGGSDAEQIKQIPINSNLRWLLAGIPAYAFGGLTLLAVSGQATRYWRVAVPAFLAMIGLVTLAFMLWLHLGIPTLAG